MVYGYGTHSHPNSTEYRAMKREMNETNPAYSAGGRTGWYDGLNFNARDNRERCGYAVNADFRRARQIVSQDHCSRSRRAQSRYFLHELGQS